MANFSPPFARPLRATRPTLFAWLLLALTLLPLLALATPRPTGPAAPSIASALNPDGSLRADAHGSFDVRGYRMLTAPDGHPVFSPMRTAGAGDVYWQDGFGVPGTNGTVYAVVRVGTDTYVGGVFSIAGTVIAKNIAKWNGTAWSALGAGMNDYVVALAVDGSGNLYAGGRFTTAGGTAANYIAKWNGTAWSALGAGLNDYVYAFALDGSGNLYASGLFTTAGGTAANRIARWNGTAWSALGTGMNNAVYALAVDGSGTVYAGGLFTTAGGTAANRIAKWNGTAWSALGAGLNDQARALVVDGSGNLYVGGEFTTAGGTTASRIARWNGTAWSALGSGMNDYVADLDIDGSGNLYAAGAFTTAGGTAANYIAKWNGTAWSTLGTGANNQVLALAVDGSGNLYAGGIFSAAGGTPAGFIANWNGTAWSALGTGMDSAVYALVADGNGNVYAGGNFTNAGSTAANRIAKWNGTTWSALGTGMNDQVYRLAVDGSGNLYAGGRFTTAGGTAASRIARWNGTAWSALGAGLNDALYALAVDGSGNVYAGGYFTTAGGTAANRIARWNGTAWSALGTGMNDAVYALTVAGSGTVYASGLFTTAGGTAANRIAQWNGTAWSTLGTGMNDNVFALAVDGSGNLYAGGAFTTAGGTGANYIARWNGTAWSALGAGVGDNVVALALDGNGNLYASGYFTTAGGTAANYIAKWNGTAWSALGTGLQGLVQALAAKTGSVYAGGNFTTVGDGSKVTAYFGIYNPPSVPVITSFTPTSGPVGTTLTITGTGLSGATAITFTGTSGNVVTTGFTVASSTSITGIVVPSGAQTGTLTVTTPGGTSAASSQTFTLTPTITNFTPTSGPVGTTLTITGAGLSGATAITFTGTSGNVVTTGFTVNGAGTQITGVVVPAGAQTGTLTVTTPGGTSAASSQTFTLTPAITSFTPTSGPAGTTLTVTGTNLAGATAITFTGTSGNVVTTGFTVNGAGTQITGIVVPSGVQTGPLTVTTPIGTSAASSQTFTIAVAPIISSFTPASGPTGTSVTITGTGLDQVTGVRFGTGALTANFTAQAATSLTVLVPVVAATGVLTLTNGTGNVATSGSQVFTYTPRPVGLQAELSPAGPLDVCQPQTLTASAVVPGFNISGMGFNNAPAVLAIQTDDKVLAAGYFGSYNGSPVPNGVVRLNPNGSLDATFNPGGTGFDNYEASLAVQADGHILVSGYSHSYNGSPVPNGVVRLNPDGSLDATFNPGGSGFDDIPAALAIQADGKVLAAGYGSSYNGSPVPYGLVRLNSNGSLDATFNPGGSGFNSILQTLALQADGTVLTGGYFSSYNGNPIPGGVVRLSPNGSLDATFNPGGSGFASSDVGSLALQADGRVLAVGGFSSYNGSAVPGYITRLNADGSRHTTSTPLSGAAFTFSPGATTTNPLVVNTPGTYSVVASVGGITSAPSHAVLVTDCRPLVTGVSPAFGPAGTVVTLTGSNFGGATQITFSGANGNVVTTGFTVNSAGTQITGVLVPGGTQSGPISVTASLGTSVLKMAFFSLTRTLAASSSGDHTLQVRLDGTLWAWGSNGNGQLGDNSYTNQASPVQIGSATSWVSVSAGQFHSLALRTDGTLWGWGRNSEGQVGDGTGGQQGAPVQVGTDTDWVNVAAGTYHSLAVKADGTLWTWGYNGFGQLGYGYINYAQYVPQQVGTDHDWTNVVAGASHVVAVKANGTLWTWGYNGGGGLGDGTANNNATPTQVGTATDWVAPFPSENNSLVLKTSGALWSWGQNGSGQLGDGTTTDQYYPAQLGTATDWRRAASSGGHTLALRTSGTLWSWGSNSNGQLGDGTTIDHYLPAQVGAATNWLSVGAGNGHSVGEQSCSAWAWGQNSSGQVGNGTTTDQYSPVQVYNPGPPPTATTTWNGSTSTDWNSCANWSYGQVPTAAYSAMIPAGLTRYPSLTAGTYATGGLTLASGASLTTAAGATLQVSGDWANNGGTAILNGPVQFVGTTAQAVGGSASTAFEDVTVDKASGSLTLGRDLAIGTSLTLTTGTLTTTATYKVALSSTATLSETETSYVAGAVEVTRNLNTAGTGSSFGGVGLTLTPAAGSSAVPGSTFVRRVTGSPVTGAGGSMGIGRYFVITPTVDQGLNVTMVHGYFDHELNGIPEANLKLYKSTSGTAGPWQSQAGTTNDATANTVTKAGITDFSTWALGNSAAPLPVQLVAFTAVLQDRGVALAWRTASEANSAYFEVERSVDGVTFAAIGRVAAQGSKTTATDYTLLDGKLPAGATTLYYRLRQVDLDGTAAYSPVRAVALPGAAFQAYPVPAHAGQVLTVAGAKAGTGLEVLDALGRRVATTVADAAGAAQLTLPAGLAAGVYVLRGGTQVQRLVVE